MTVTASVARGEPAGLDALRYALAEARVVFVVDQAPILQLAAALANPAFSASELVIGRGQPPIPGSDGHFEPAFHVGLQPGHVAEDGTMNFFDREALKPFAPNACVGRLIAPVPGVNGRRVDGAELKVPAPRPTKLRIGANLRVATDGHVYAMRAGVVRYDAERSLELVQYHVHEGDVDLRSGNLDMNGSLLVRGSVQRSFQARASGDVEIGGGVDSGSVYAGASLLVRGGVRGGESGMVCAEGDAALRHADAAHVLCGGALVLESAINSQLAAATIQIARTVRGGSAQAEHSLVVKDAAVAHGTGALLAAGVPLSRPILDVQRALAVLKEQRTLQRSAGSRGVGDAKLERRSLALEREELGRKAELASRRQELLRSACVQITGSGEAGIAIQIGLHSLTLNERVTQARFSYDPKTGGIRMERSGR